jgi:PKHD-type hydroxylase
VFLSDPDSYDGGALVIEDHFEARAIKLSAGEVILYPSTTLHRVEPVTRGTRLAVVGWVQSLIRDPAHREILFDLDQAVDACFAAEGKSAQFDWLSKTRSNLLRMWVET